MPVVVVCKVQRQKKAEFSSCELHFGLPQLTLDTEFYPHFIDISPMQILVLFLARFARKIKS